MRKTKIINALYAAESLDLCQVLLIEGLNLTITSKTC